MGSGFWGAREGELYRRPLPTIKTRHSTQQIGNYLVIEKKK